MHVDHFDALVANAYFAPHHGTGRGLLLPATASTAAPLPRILSQRVALEDAVRNPQSRRRARHALYEISAIRHILLPNSFNAPEDDEFPRWGWPVPVLSLDSSVRLSQTAQEFLCSAVPSVIRLCGQLCPKSLARRTADCAPSAT